MSQVIAYGAKRQKWIISNTKGRYLYRSDDWKGKPYNSVNFWVKDKRRATRYKDEQMANFVISNHLFFMKSSELLIKEEIWE